MKKYFFFAACASVAFASCVNDVPDAPVNDEQHAITFGVPVVQPNSRTTYEVGEGYEGGESFKVTAWYFSENYISDAANTFMNNVLVQYNATSSEWEPQGNYYWPKNGTLTFMAYSPSDLNITLNENRSFVINNFTVDPNDAGQQDILFSERTYNLDYDSSTNGEADIKFNHALSSILFKAKTNIANDQAEVTIKSIQLVDIYDSGAFAQNIDNLDGKLTNTPERAARYESEKNEGNNGIDSTSVLSTNMATWTAIGSQVDYSVSGVGTGMALNTSLKTAFTSAGSPKNTDLILIPQKFTTGNNTEAKLLITYDIDVKGNGDGVDFANQVYSKNLSEFHDEWKMGYRYTYNISINLAPITFAPTVEAWVDAEAETPAP